MINARDDAESSADEDKATATATTSGSSSTTTADAATTSSTASTTKAKPKLSKARTMKGTAKVIFSLPLSSCIRKPFDQFQEAKALLAGEVLGDTRADTKRRQAAVNAKKALQEVSKASSGRKPALKRLGTMANTAKVMIY